MTTVSHVGMCVSDLDASERFYVEVLGFVRQRVIEPPDSAVGPLLSIEPPVGLRAVFLTNGPFTLELLGYGDAAVQRQPRTFTHVGLTHLSMRVDDVDAVVARAVSRGATVRESTDLGVAVVIEDPDGQAIELVTGEF